MKTNKTFFLVTLLLASSCSAVIAHDEDATVKKAARAAVEANASVVDSLVTLVRRSVNYPLTTAAISAYFMHKVGADLYNAYVAQYGSVITDSGVVQTVENAVPCGYGKGFTKNAFSAMVGYFAFAAVREILLGKNSPDVVRTPVEVVTRAAK